MDILFIILCVIAIGGGIAAFIMENGGSKDDKNSKER